MKSIDGKIFKQMVISGSNNLYNYYPEVDALNVFPIPDGDTGMNMNLTMTSAAKLIANRNDESIYAIAKGVAEATFNGSRGNSGVITSQIFKGISVGLQDKKVATAQDLADAFVSAAKVAYKGVKTPVEGTILTVIREASAHLASVVKPHTSVEEAFQILVDEAYASLERTPNLLPVLKEVGVVDSGGAGLCKILDGMNDALLGNFVERNEQSVTEVGTAAQTQFSEDEEFGYCTEFILRLGPDEEKKTFNKNRFINVLNSHGNSLVCVQDEDLVKVHVHTLKPGDIFNYAQQFGEFVKMKCENMSEQHHEILVNEANGGPEMAAAKLKSAPLKAPKAKEKEKDFALIATSSGKGIDELFKEVGVTEIVSGGQTMNPSIKDFLDAIERANAKVIYIFPNNSNIILAANQAKESLAGKKDVYVIPTKTINQGVVAAMNFNSDLSKEDNFEVMNEAMTMVKSGAITFSIKDTTINGVEIKKDEFMAIKGTKEILSCHKDKIDALFALLDNLIDDDSAICTILTGEDISEKEFEEIQNKFVEKYKLVDLDIRNGGQPVYSFLVGVE